MYVRFRCEECKDPKCYKHLHDELPKVNSKPYITAYDEVYWCEEPDDKSNIIEKGWAWSDRQPNVSEIRVLFVCDTFYAEENVPFWTMYYPSSSANADWDDYPEEIDQSAFVQCELVGIIKQENSEALVQVNVLTVIPLADMVLEDYISKRLLTGDEIVTDNEFRKEFFDLLDTCTSYFSSIHRQVIYEIFDTSSSGRLGNNWFVTNYKNWQFFSYNDQSYLNAWFLFYKLYDISLPIAYGCGLPGSSVAYLNKSKDLKPI